MNRRQVLTATSVALCAGGLGLGLPSAVHAASRKPALMKLGTGVEDVDDATLKAVVRWGVRNVYARAQIADPKRLYPTVDELKRMREAADRNGVSIDILRPTFLSMRGPDTAENPAIMLGASPQRDRDIEAFQTMIRNAAAAGIPAIRYTLAIQGLQRNGKIQGRGDATYRSSTMSEYRLDAPLTSAGRVTQDMYWERITYFLDRVVPVANEYKVRLLSHMEDAMVPDGYRGLSPVTNTVEGAKRFVSIQESPYHGLLFCVGTFSEMLENPKRDIYDVVRWFGARKKIFMVDFRNIQGNRRRFAESFPDDGDVDMLRVMQTLRDVGYDGMVCPDHYPATPVGQDHVDAFQYGYIRGLIQAVGGRV